MTNPETRFAPALIEPDSDSFAALQAMAAFLVSYGTRVTAMPEMAYRGWMDQTNHRPGTGCVIIERW